jgi:cytochrome c peroxidase
MISRPWPLSQFDVPSTDQSHSVIRITAEKRAKSSTLRRARRLFWTALLATVATAFHPANLRAAEQSDVPLTADRQPAWAAHAASQARDFRFPDTFLAEPTPLMIPQFQLFSNPSGQSGNYQPSGSTSTEQQAFFAPLGTNERTCLTCHQPTSGWSITPKQIQKAFSHSDGREPLFNPIDGAVCPNVDVSSYEKRQQAYALLLKKGLIRTFIQLPATPILQFSIVNVIDHFGCNTNPTFGLTNFGAIGSTTGTVSVYRRPLPTTNLRFLTAIMWDGREPSLESQATDAALIHFQATSPPSAAQVSQIVDFMSGLYSAQVRSSYAGSLTTDGAQGGPQALAQQAFYVGINDPLGTNPTGTAFTPVAMTIFQAWDGQRLSPERDAIARGEKLFNERPITITGVAGLNDRPGLATVNGFCTTCHDAPNVGDHSVKLPLNIGVVAPSVGGLDTDGLPVFTILCNTGPLAGQTFHVTDPAKALISGQCADIGKTKGPILRNLAARPPYFHNGSAPDLRHVVNFYNNRFAIGFTEQEMSDLVSFLSSL